MRIKQCKNAPIETLCVQVAAAATPWSAFPIPSIPGEIDGTVTRFTNDYQTGGCIWGVGDRYGNCELPGPDTDVAVECKRPITFQSRPLSHLRYQGSCHFSGEMHPGSARCGVGDWGQGGAGGREGDTGRA